MIYKPNVLYVSLHCCCSLSDAVWCFGGVLPESQSFLPSVAAPDSRVAFVPRKPLLSQGRSSSGRDLGLFQIRF